MADSWWPIVDKVRNIFHKGKLIELSDSTFAQAVAIGDAQTLTSAGTERILITDDQALALLSRMCDTLDKVEIQLSIITDVTL